MYGIKKCLKNYVRNGYNSYIASYNASVYASKSLNKVFSPHNANNAHKRAYRAVLCH
jgi:hypothetical protein